MNDDLMLFSTTIYIFFVLLTATLISPLTGIIDIYEMRYT